MQNKMKKQLEEISFVLQNIFIVHPNPNSKYKIRIIVNRNNSDNSFRKISNRYIFKVSPNSGLKEKACYLVLLQKTKREGANSQYLQIGRAQVNLSEIIQDQQIKNQTLINGVVYGTRSHNYDRIVGKYSYKVFKLQNANSPSKQTKTQKSIKPALSNIKKKEKTDFPFQQSILNQERDLQSKIKELTNSMNKIMSAQEIQEPYQVQQFASAGLMPIKESTLDQSQYYYKYNQKLVQLLNNPQANPKQLSTLVIKNIRVENRSQKSQEKEKMMLQTVKVQNPKLNGIKKHRVSRKMQQALIVFYQLFQQKKVRRRLLQIYVPTYFNKDNRNLVHQLFYLPKTSNKILMEIAFVTDSFNKYKNLNGVIPYSVAKSRLIQLYDLDNIEKGIMVCQIQNCTQIDKEQLKSYKKQSGNFDKILRRHGKVSQFAKKPKIAQVKQQVVPKQTKNLDNSAKDTLYSNFHQNKQVKNIKRKRYTTSFDQNSGNLAHMTPSISRFNRSETTSKQNLSVSSKNSTRFFSKSIRAFPTMLQSVVKKGQTPNFSSKDVKYRLYIQAGQFNIYQMNKDGTKMLLKMNINSRSNSKKVVLGQSQWLPLHIQFKQFAMNDCLGVQLLLNKKNTTIYKKIGDCNIALSELQNTKNKYKAYISHKNKIIGYIWLKFRLFRKEADQKSQSFYYQENMERHSLIKSERSEDRNRDLNQPFDDRSGIVFQADSDKSFNNEDDKDDHQQFQLSFESRQIQPAKTKNMHYISEKVSEGRMSEQLQNQDYQNGQAIHRRF